MTHSRLNGLSLLVVEDQPLVAMDIAQAFEIAGAHITNTNTLRHAMILAEHDGLSGAILDHSLGDGSSQQLYARLKERGIPFMVYSGYTRHDGIPEGVPLIMKPASHEQLVAAMEELVKANPRRV